MERETEPMAEAPSESSTDSEVGEAVARFVERRRAIDGRASGTSGETRGQRPGKTARPGGRIPHGVESAPTADDEQRWNLGTRPRCRPPWGTDGRSDRRTREAGAEPA